MHLVVFYAATLFLVGCYAILRDSKGGKAPRIYYSVPTVGVMQRLQSSSVSGLRSILETSKWAFQGYNKYSKCNMPFIVAGLDKGPVVVVPRQQLKLYGQPESILDMRMTAETIIQFKYTCPDQQVRETRLEIGVVRKQLSRNLTKITPQVGEELKLGFKRTWGTSTKWKRVKGWASSRKVIMGAANAAFSGDFLVRNTKFLDLVEQHTMCVFSGAFFISCLPTFLQPIAGFVVKRLVDWHSDRAAAHCMEYICDRLDKTAKLQADRSFDWTPPNDGLQWLIEESYASPLDGELRADRVWHRLLILNNVSLLTTSYTVTNVLFDLFSSDPEMGYVDILRDEAAEALKSTGGVWTMESVNKLRLIDSAIRESMRVSPMGPLLHARTVMHPDGINLEGSNVKAGPKTILAVPVEAIHHDEDIYHDAKRFDPFRFAHPDDVVSDSSDKEKEKQKLIVTLDDSFLSFGTGRWACPGRFFASMEMKIFLATVLLNYEVEFMAERPKPTQVLWMNLMPWASFRVRKRAGVDFV